MKASHTSSIFEKLDLFNVFSNPLANIRFLADVHRITFGLKAQIRRPIVFELFRERVHQRQGLQSDLGL